MQLSEEEIISEQELSISNPLNKDRTLVPIEIKLSDLNPEMQVDSQSSLLVCLADSVIASQLDDLNGDSIKDELLFQLDIKRDENLKVRVCKVNSDIANKYVFESGVHAQMGLKNGTKSFIIKDSIFSESGDLYKEIMHHGPALESQHIAYRMYFDDRSSVDVYGKIHHRLELDTTKWYSSDEFIANEYGGDILFVKNTMGVGSLRMWNGRASQKIKATKGRYGVIRSRGPVRSVVDMCAMGVEGTNIIMSRMIIYSGHREMIYRVYADELKQELCTGIRKMDGADVRLSNSDGWLMEWGTDYPRLDHDKYPKVTVGLGVLVPRQYLKPNYTTDSLNHIMRLKLRGNALEYYVSAVWNKQKNGIVSADEMEKFMQNLSEDVNHPIVITKR